MPTLATDKNKLLLPPWQMLGVFLVLLAAWRHLIGADLPLSVDEAYYVAWSKSPDWGYWTKPPMIAWAIGGARWVCGETAACIRLTSLLAFPLTAVVLMGLSLRMGASKGAACMVAALFASLPLSSFYGIAATTDAFLLLFWACAMLSLWLAVEGKRWAWPLLGVSFGLGMLSKYTMVVFGLNALLILLHPKWRHHWKSAGPYVALGLALLVFSPNVLWNVSHHMPTFQHTADISQGGNRYGLHWEVLGKFLLEQWLIGNPVLVAAALLFFWRGLRHGEAVKWFALASALPIVLVISTQALLSRAHANWAAPAYLGVCLGAVHVLWPHRKKAMVAAMVFNVLFATALYHYQTLIAQPLQLRGTAAADPFWALRPWPALVDAIEQSLAAHVPDKTHWRVASEDRAVLAQTQAILRLPAGHAMGWQRLPQPDHHFDQHFALPVEPQKPVLLITRLPDEEVKKSYPRANNPQTVQQTMGQETLIYRLWWLGPPSSQ